jgi:hypothetical protein
LFDHALAIGPDKIEGFKHSGDVMKNIFLRAGLVLVFLACGAFAADDVVSGVAGSVKAVDKAAKTVSIKAADGTEHTFHFIGRTVAHGAEATASGAKDAFLDMKEGDEVVVHYTEKGAVKTAQEVDHIGKGGMKMSEVVVKSVDRGAKTVTVKTAEGAEETYHLTATAARETGQGLDKAGKVTIYYTEEGGKKIAHFFKEG